MRVRDFIFVACIVLSFLAGAALATAAATTGFDRTAIFADQEAGTIRIVVGGKPAAWFDAEGLHVIQAIEYGDTLTDTGTRYLEDKAGASGAH